jgi:hypothetical protein
MSRDTLEFKEPASPVAARVVNLGNALGHGGKV